MGGHNQEQRGAAKTEDRDDNKEHHTASMGRVRTKPVKRASRTIIEKYYSRMTLDFDINKRLCDDVAIIQSKRLPDKIAVDRDTKAMLKYMNMGNHPGVQLQQFGGSG